MKSVDVVVPVRNEGSTVAQLARQLDTSLKTTTDNYKLIFIVDPSTDSTVDALLSIQKDFPVLIENKKGKPGKGYSLIEGIEKSDADYVVFIDGDLQYPTSIIPQMVEMLNDEKIGVVVANRVSYQSSLIRRIGSRLNRFIFGKLLLGFGCDIQSGLKVFRRSIFQHIDKSLIGPWTFDIPLLHTALQLGYQIGEVDIEYAQRTSGKSKVKVVKTAFSIASCAIKTAAKEHRIFHLDHESKGVHGSIMYKKHQFTPHTLLPHHKSAIVTATRVQQIIIGAIFLLLIGSFIAAPLKTAIVLTAILTFIYFSDVLFSVYLILKSLHFPPELSFTDEELKNITDDELPIYSVLCPLYKEAQVLPQFVEAMEKMDYPKTKMDILILLEENDLETIEVANKMNLPEYYRIVVVPHSQPKTKPKACNYGIHLAKGEYMVVYDAEDIPEPKQLKKGYLAFKQVKPNVICVQAKLNYYNPHQNLLTTLFTAEYSLWFDVILPGLQSINTIIPLGGTSNHFRTKELLNLHAWDPFNVTEDCDLGVRLFKDGYKTEIMDSTTLEEANSNVKNWIRQRSRWIKGYLQTYLVHMRDPWKFVKQHKWHALIFQLIIGLRISFILINPFLWAMTIAYFTLYKYVGPTIEALYPAPIFYMAAFALVFGNFMYLYNYMIGLAKRGHWDVIKFVFVVPFYWAMMGISATIAFWQLIFKPHFWEKTHHGLHLHNKEQEVIPAKNGLFGQFKLPKIQIARSYFSGAFLISAVLFSNFINYVYNGFLSRKVGLEDFGFLNLFANILFVGSLFFNALNRSVAYKSGYSYGKQNIYAHNFWKRIRGKALYISLVITLIWVSSIPLLTGFFNTNTYLPFLLFTPIWILSVVNAIDYGYLNGSHQFFKIGIVLVVESTTRLITTILFVMTGHPDLIIVAYPISMTLSLLFGYTFARKLSKKNIRETTLEVANMRFPVDFFVSSLLIGFSTVSFISFDVIIAKHVLSPQDAGYYSLISLTGKMVFFLSTLGSQFIVPLVSKQEGENKNSISTFYKLFGLTSLFGIFSYLIFGYGAFITSRILFGAKILPVINFIPTFALGILLFTLASVIIGYYQLKNRAFFLIISVFIALLQISLLSIFGKDVKTFVNINVFVGSIALALTTIAHVFNNQTATIYENLLDFIDIFRPLPQSITNFNGKKVLIFNWRDTKHVWAGGAEVYVHEIAKRLVAQNMVAVVFCGNDQHCKRYEVIDNVHIIRRGGFFTVYIWAVIYYICKFRFIFDVIIDSENGIPFFTPLYSRKPIIGLIHHVHQEIIIKELALAFHLKPAAYLAKFLETKAMPVIYRNKQMITVSNSTLDDMHKIGLGKNKEIKIINPGVTLEAFHTGKKTASPTILYVGRIKSYKSIEVVIRSMTSIIKQSPEAKLNIAGSGEHQPILQKLTKELGLENCVEFLGKVTEELKVELMAQSWVFVYPSLWEGWGISIIEANACGTPVVASKVKGLIDSVDNPHSGYLVEYGNSELFAEKIIEIITNTKLRKSLEKSSIQHAKQYTWDNSANKLVNLIEEVTRE